MSGEITDPRGDDLHAPDVYPNDLATFGVSYDDAGGTQRLVHAARVAPGGQLPRPRRVRERERGTVGQAAAGVRRDREWQRDLPAGEEPRRAGAVVLDHLRRRGPWGVRKCPHLPHPARRHPGGMAVHVFDAGSFASTLRLRRRYDLDERRAGRQSGRRGHVLPRAVPAGPVPARRREARAAGDDAGVPSHATAGGRAHGTPPPGRGEPEVPQLPRAASATARHAAPSPESYGRAFTGRARAGSAQALRGARRAPLRRVARPIGAYKRRSYTGTVTITRGAAAATPGGEGRTATAHAERLGSERPRGQTIRVSDRLIRFGRRGRARPGLASRVAMRPTESPPSAARGRHRGVWWRPDRSGWWMGMLFAVGSICFAVASFASQWASAPRPAIGVTFFAGSIFFTLAAFVQLRTAPSRQRPGGGARPVRGHAVLQREHVRGDAARVRCARDRPARLGPGRLRLGLLPRLERPRLAAVVERVAGARVARVADRAR